MVENACNILLTPSLYIFHYRDGSFPPMFDQMLLEVPRPLIRLSPRKAGRKATMPSTRIAKRTPVPSAIGYPKGFYAWRHSIHRYQILQVFPETIREIQGMHLVTGTSLTSVGHGIVKA
jgi:hypothetical protein